MKMKKTVTLLLTVLLLCLALTPCAGASAPAADSSAQPEAQLIAGILEPNSLESATQKQWMLNRGAPSIHKQVEFIAFSSLNAMLMELSAGRVDYLRLPSSVANYVTSVDDTLIIKVMKGAGQQFQMAVRAEDTALCDEMNSAIDALQASGALDQLAGDYITHMDGAPSVNALAHHEGGETHIVAVTGDLPPLDYVAADGTPAGFNVALLNAISETTGCNFEIVQLEAPARLSALVSGKVDLIFWISCWSSDGFEPTEAGVCLTRPYFAEDLCNMGYGADMMDRVEAMYKNMGRAD
ncbi:MAG: transporter substrate-binding domain-containing protein [Clostridia bacterium]